MWCYIKELQNLDEVVGGATLSASLLNSFTNIIKTLIDVGRSIGSSIRRIGEGGICPLE